MCRLGLGRRRRLGIVFKAVVVTITILINFWCRQCRNLCLQALGFRFRSMQGFEALLLLTLCHLLHLLFVLATFFVNTLLILGAAALDIEALGLAALGLTALPFTALAFTPLGFTPLGFAALGFAALGLMAVGVTTFGLETLGIYPPCLSLSRMLGLQRHRAWLG